VSVLERRRRTLRSPGGPALAAWESGPRDGPPVVLLHGLTMTGEKAFSRVSALERRGFRVVAFDARGHGRSEPAAGPAEYGYEQLAADLLAVMDGLEVACGVLAGVSLGAHTALRVALREPDRVAGLAVVSPAFDPARHPNEESIAEAAELARAIRERGADGFVAAMRVPRGLREDRAAIRASNALTRRRLAGHRHLAAIGDALEGAMRSRPFERFDELAEITVPALVVGTHDELDPRHPLAVARAYSSALAGSRFACEEPGQMPLGWGGSRLTALVGDLAEAAHAATN
jgi:pimeloyl-ACP methyl ester carboxylesterase